jgi:hypothetical protein
MHEKYPFLTKEVLEKDYAELQSVSAIAKKYNMPVSSVKNRTKKFNVKLNSCKQPKYTIDEDIFSRNEEIGFYPFRQKTAAFRRRMNGACNGIFLTFY